MNLDRLRWGEWIAAIAALDLLLVTFRAWYKVSGGGGRVTGWDALEQGKYLLIATAVVGIFLWLVRAAEDTEFPIGWVAAAVGFACTVYVAYRLATPPSDNLDPDIGLYLGLVSALGVTIGGLISAREPARHESGARTASEVAADTFTGPTGARSEPLGDLVPDSGGTGTWSPAAPAATTGWSPASPASPPPPATPAGAAAAGHDLRPGDSVVLTAGSARFPAGTVADVVQAFAGGALVEVRAADGVAERFEVPESAYEPASGGGLTSPGGESWSPAMPAPASEDWGFDESAAGAGIGSAAGKSAAAGSESKAAKTPWWKREIGGGKKQKDDDSHAAEIGAAGAVAAGAAAVAAGTNGSREEKPGFFKRLFGGGGAKAEPETETLEGETTPATDTAGIGQAAESDTAVDEGATTGPQAEPTAGPGPEIASEAAAGAPEPEAIAEPPGAEPMTTAPEPVPPAPEPMGAAPEPDPERSAPEPSASVPEPETAAVTEAEASAPEPAAPAGEAAGAEPDPTAPAPEAAASPREPEVLMDPEPAASAEPEASSADGGASTPEPDASAAAAGAGAAAASSAEEAKPRRKRSSGSRNVPKEALNAAGDAQPRVGDEVQLKVGGGKYDAGTKGTVVDVFSAGVIVELSDDNGRTERLDLPFEAIGPADA